MDNHFRTRIDVPPSSFKLNPGQPVLAVGSCFAEHIGRHLEVSKFPILVNPSGIMFNPGSVADTLTCGLEGKLPPESLLVKHDDLYFSFLHHGKFASTDRSVLLELLADQNRQLQVMMKTAEVVILTLGTAWVYRHRATGRIVANCHKQPVRDFIKEMLTVEQVVQTLEEALDAWKALRPRLKIIMSVSPVRHWRDGAIANQRSKATLLLAVSALQAHYPELYYFPAYEILLDELRDYRFYNSDMLHPSPEAVAYIWQHFQQATMEEETRAFVRQMEDLQRSLRHHALHPQSKAHQQFLRQLEEKIHDMQRRYPAIDFSSELEVLRLG